jgi:hypothetical protein
MFPSVALDECSGTAIVAQQTDISRTQYTKCRLWSPPEDEQVMLETYRGSWFSINWMKGASRWFHNADVPWGTVSKTLRTGYSHTGHELSYSYDVLHGHDSVLSPLSGYWRFGEIYCVYMQCVITQKINMNLYCHENPNYFLPTFHNMIICHLPYLILHCIASTVEPASLHVE